MHNKRMLIKAKKFHSLLWTRGRKCMDVVLKDEIPMSKGQVSAKQGQELWNENISPVCEASPGSLAIWVYQSQWHQSAARQWQKQLHHVPHSKQKQSWHPCREREKGKKTTNPTKPNHHWSSLQLWITANSWTINPSQVPLKCLLTPTTATLHIYHNSAGCFAKSEILILTYH